MPNSTPRPDKIDQNREGVDGQTTDVFTKAFTLTNPSTVALSSVDNSQPTNMLTTAHNTFTAGALQASTNPSATASSLPVAIGSLDFDPVGRDPNCV